MRELRLRIAPPPSRTVPVRVGAGALRDLVRGLATRPPGSLVAVISDSNVADLYGVDLCRAIRVRTGLRAALLRFPAGEASKTRETKAIIEDRLAAHGAGRDTLIVALGGGVTGDLAGFVAATWHRGISLVQAPTSLLAMADAAVGGKTGVDLPAAKNLVGAFHHPTAVFADLSVLSTLPAAEWRSGLAEIVKAAVVGDAGLFRLLERSRSGLPKGAVLEAALERSLRVKLRLVSVDEREAGPRAALNFGHTAAHALEAASRYRISHGESVAVGMMVEARLARESVGFPSEELDRLRRLLVRMGLPVSWPPAVRPAAALAAARLDKKNRAAAIRCALPHRIGALAGPPWTRAVEEPALRAAMARTI